MLATLPLRVLHPVTNLRASLTFLKTIYRQRELVRELTKNELSERYAGQVLGAAWAFLHPVLLAAVYVFIFSVVFKVRLDQKGMNVSADFTMYILAGLIPWLAVQELLVKSTTVIRGHSNLVKQMIFPIEVLPAKCVFATLATEIILVGALLAYSGLRMQFFPWTLLLLPLLLFIQVTLMLGLALILSAVGTYFRDLKDVIQLFTLVSIYMMPIVYLPQMVPPQLRPLIDLNPFTSHAYCFQDVLFYGRIEHPVAWIIFPAMALLALGVGTRMFGKFRHSFGNVL